MSPNRPLIRPTGNHTKPFETAEDLMYVLSDGTTIFIPMRYKTDFASLPWYLRPFADPYGDDCSAFLIHDWLYTEGGYYTSKEDYDRPNSDEGWIRVNRKFADNEMRHRQALMGSSEWRVRTFYRGVRIGGASRFNKT